jgi:heptosyltransferase-1
VKIFSYLSRGDSNGVSDFSHLLKAPIRPGLIPGKKYVCLMPSSRWQNKEWPVSNYVQWIQKSSLFPVVLGTPNDVASQALVKALESLKIEHQNEIGRSSFSDLAHLLKGATGFVGSDTGLFHFAESFGTRCAVFFGPTMPDQGFGPQKPATTVVIQKDLGCRPCGKDGRFCYRVFDRAACLRSISPKEFFSNNGFGEQKSDTP